MTKYLCNFLLLFLLLSVLASCYQLEKNVKQKVFIQTFENKTTIYGIQLELASKLPEVFRAQTSLQATQSFGGRYKINGAISKYQKKIIRRDTSGEPTHQQVLINIEWQILDNDQVIYEGESCNEDHNLNSGLYNISKFENESSARIDAINHLASIIAEKAEVLIKLKN